MEDIPDFVHTHTQDLYRKITAEKDRLIMEAIVNKVIKPGLITEPPST